jgi:hypothetical protein
VQNRGSLVFVEQGTARKAKDVGEVNAGDAIQELI